MILLVAMPDPLLWILGLFRDEFVTILKVVDPPAVMVRTHHGDPALRNSICDMPLFVRNIFRRAGEIDTFVRRLPQLVD